MPRAASAPGSSPHTLRELGWLAAALALIFLLARYTALDHAVTALFYDPVARNFPLRDQAFWSVIMHTGLKSASLLLWFALLIAWLLSWRRPDWGAFRRAAGFTLLVAPLAALAVSWLRALSAHSCPWDLGLYGGSADYFRFFDPLPPNPGPGRCAPSGHAASGFAWLAAWIGMRHVDRAGARIVLVISIAVGMLAGLTQLARGAHFLSHVLLTAWICLAVAWAGAWVLQQWRAAAGPRPVRREGR